MFHRSARKRKEEEYVLDPGTEYTKRNVHQVPEYYGWLGLLFILILGMISRHMYLSLPKAIMIKDMDSNPGRFVAERSWIDLQRLTEMGPRVTGTYNNEVLGVDFLKREIGLIQQTANKRQLVELDHQIVSGSYFAMFKPHGMTNMYQNVQNIVVKLQGEQNSSVLLNCHFDSVAGSPGASDDAASCCVMLETLRMMSRQDRKNRHSVIFLFNGAEETPLQAAHGFVMQHKWAKDVRALLNWESVGSGGKEMLFQTGPFHPWLVQLYGKSAPHPNAQSVAEEVFQSGLIPSDTDFRIFRDFGGVVGMDFAHIVNGYRYHTRYDHINYIPHEVLQRTGDNCLELTKTFANSEYLDDPKNYSEGQSVFFDIGGMVFFNYSKNFGVILNVSVALLSFMVPYLFLMKVLRGVNSKYVVSEILLSVVIMFTSIILSLGAAYLMAWNLGITERTMSWYTNTWMAIGLYSVPTILITCALHSMGRKKNIPISLGLKIQARLLGSNIFHSILTLVITLAGYRAGYVQMVVMLVFLISNGIIGICGLQNSIKTWVYVHVIGQIVTILWTTQLYHITVLMFIPITGRSGGGTNPEFMIGYVSVALTVLITSYLTPLILLLRTKKRFLWGLLIAVFLFRFVPVFLGSDFPYRDDYNRHPTPQRLFITHTSRNFYDRNGTLRHSDSGFWMRELDRNAKKTIESLSAPGTPIEQNAEFCKNEVFCALPTYSSRQLHTGSYWLPASAPLIRTKAKFELLSQGEIREHTQRMIFKLSNQGVTSLQIRPKENVELVYWNLVDRIPEQNHYHDQKGYFVMITHGTEPTPFNVTLDFKTPPGYNVKSSGLIDLSVVTNHWEYQSEHTPSFTNLIVKVPKWAFLVPSVAAVDVFEY